MATPGKRCSSGLPRGAPRPVARYGKQDHGATRGGRAAAPDPQGLEVAGADHRSLPRRRIPRRPVPSLRVALVRHGYARAHRADPVLHYVASLARAQEIRTTVGTYSFHHIAPELFGGFEIQEPSGVKLATAEKAIFDLAYFSSVRSRRFAAVPELHLPRRFRWSIVGAWVERIAAPATRVRLRLERLLR